MEPVSIVVPVYNETDAIAGTADRLRALCARLPEGSEIVFVDDGSTDGSADQLDAAALGPAIRVVRHARNRGYGAALKSGIAAATNDLIAITDADGTYPIAAIPRLAALVSEEGYTMAVGARRDQHVQLIRRPAKALLRALAEHLTGERIPDLNSGLRVFRRWAFQRHRNLLPDQFSFTTTITMALLTEGEPVAFVPIRYAKRTGSSKIRPIRDTMGFLLLILRTTVAFNPLRVFAPLALLFLLAGAALLVARLVADQSFGIATTVTCFVAGLNMLAIGLLADLVNRRSRS